MVLILGHSVIIPAIMHGNLMLGTLEPALSGFATFANKILGGLIGAHRTTKGFWYLSNGIRLNSSLASASLLKGLAYSGIGSAALLSPVIAGVVIAIKNLKGKIKKKELKQDLEDVKTNDNNEEIEKIKNNKKKNEDSISKEILKLFKKYKKSGLELKVFAINNKLSDKEVQMLIALDEMIEERENSKGGRK